MEPPGIMDSEQVQQLTTAFDSCNINHINDGNAGTERQLSAKTTQPIQSKNPEGREGRLRNIDHINEEDIDHKPTTTRNKGSDEVEFQERLRKHTKKDLSSHFFTQHEERSEERMDLLYNQHISAKKDERSDRSDLLYNSSYQDNSLLYNNSQGDNLYRHQGGNSNNHGNSNNSNNQISQGVLGDNLKRFCSMGNMSVDSNGDENLLSMEFCHETRVFVKEDRDGNLSVVQSIV